MGSGASSEVADAPPPSSAGQMSISPQELDDADISSWKGPIFSEEERSCLSSMVGYMVHATSGSAEHKIPLRHIPATSEGNRVALCLHGYGEDRCMALWSHFWMPMLSKGFHVVALDARFAFETLKLCFTAMRLCKLVGTGMASCLQGALRSVG